ncbi:MAG TPA: hypothetical protein VH234_04545 [Candidatus Saccharimonadales bacterium]|nr:hypothetical protein [Candidatus Saccharimonadales bacterium]
MADAPAAPDATAEIDDMPDIPLIGNPPAADDQPAETPPAEPAADKGKDDAAATPPAKDGEGQGDKPAENKPAEGEEKPPTDQPAKTGEDGKPADTPKELTPEERQRAAAQAFQQRQRARTQVAQQIDQVYAPKSEEDLVNEGMDQQSAQVEALRQEMLFKEQRTQIAELNATLRSEAVEAMHDMPVFDENSKNYDPAFTQQVQAAYLRASRLQADDNGIVLNAELPLYDFYKSMYDIYERGNTQGATQQQQDAAAMLANVENPGGSSSTSKGEESLEDMEARLGDVVIGS